MDETKDPDELRAIATSIIDSNQFMTLATADRDGLPWPSPVWYAPAEYREFFWVSSPEAQHSQNVRVRPQVGIVIFDSHRTGGWNAVYMSAVAEELADVGQGIEIFSRRSEEQGFGAWPREKVVAPARHRLYRAIASEHFVLDSHDQRLRISLRQPARGSTWAAGREDASTPWPDEVRAGGTIGADVVDALNGALAARGSRG